jgi:hypothetical protein
MAFAIYSTDIDPTTDPENASPAPADLVVLDQDPIYGEYDEQAGSEGRGSVHQTFGGIVVQDFGVVSGDGRIRIAEKDALDQSTVTALRALHATVDGEYYFTNAVDIYKVRFMRPDGFKAWKNLLWAAHGKTVYSYELNLIVTEKL